MSILSNLISNLFVSFMSRRSSSKRRWIKLRRIRRWTRWSIRKWLLFILLQSKTYTPTTTRSPTTNTFPNFAYLTSSIFSSITNYDYLYVCAVALIFTYLLFVFTFFAAQIQSTFLRLLLLYHRNHIFSSWSFSFSYNLHSFIHQLYHGLIYVLQVIQHR